MWKKQTNINSLSYTKGDKKMVNVYIFKNFVINDKLLGTKCV